MSKNNSSKPDISNRDSSQTTSKKYIVASEEAVEQRLKDINKRYSTALKKLAE